jgi:hypothetical protein
MMIGKGRSKILVVKYGRKDCLGDVGINGNMLRA